MGGGKRGKREEERGEFHSKRGELKRGNGSVKKSGIFKGMVHYRSARDPRAPGIGVHYRSARAPRARVNRCSLPFGAHSARAWNRCSLPFGACSARACESRRPWGAAGAPNVRSSPKPKGFLGVGFGPREAPPLGTQIQGLYWEPKVHMPLGNPWGEKSGTSQHV